MLINNSNGGEITRHVTNSQENYVLAQVTAIIDAEDTFSAEMVTEKAGQIAGKDILVRKTVCGKKKTLAVDLKTATSRLHGYDDLDTYAFEVSSENNPGGMGWLFNESLETTHYALVWANSADGFKTMSDYCIAVVSKKAVLKYLAEHGITCRADVEAAMQSAKLGSNGKKTLMVNGVKVVNSCQLSENPTCVIIGRETLKRMAWFIWDSRTGYKRNLTDKEIKLQLSA